MDSKLVVEQMSGRWKIKHAALASIATQAKELATWRRRLLSSRNVEGDLDDRPSACIADRYGRQLGHRFAPLSAPVEDACRLGAVLTGPQIGGFEVDILVNEPSQVVALIDIDIGKRRSRGLVLELRTPSRTGNGLQYRR